MLQFLKVCLLSTLVEMLYRNASDDGNIWVICYFLITF